MSLIQQIAGFSFEPSFVSLALALLPHQCLKCRQALRPVWPSMVSRVPSFRLQLDRQPIAIKLSLGALRTLPRRIFRPPASIDCESRALGIQPLVKLQLDDVLANKHLPPLSLKDFEQWLLFVEHCPENLYFLVWLKEYTTRYQAWAQRAQPRARALELERRARNAGLDSTMAPPDISKPTAVAVLERPNSLTSSPLARSKPSFGEYRAPMPTEYSPELFTFYARATQTFFTPGPYCLDLPNSIFPFNFQGTSPFASTPGDQSTPSAQRYPDPAVFAEIASTIGLRLQESLDRLCVATYYNVGNKRASCGLVGGSFFALVGSVPPLALNFVNGRARWERLAAMPGMWLGIFIVIAAYNGVCMMVWVFGDLRQLRPFELADPVAMRPQATLGPSRGRQARTSLPSEWMSSPSMSSTISPSGELSQSDRRLAVDAAPRAPHSSRRRPPPLALAPDGLRSQSSQPSPLESRLGSPILPSTPNFPPPALLPPTGSVVSSFTAAAWHQHQRSRNTSLSDEAEPDLVQRSRESTASSCSNGSSVSSAGVASRRAAACIEISGPYYDEPPSILSTSGEEQADVSSPRRYSPVQVPITHDMYLQPSRSSSPDFIDGFNLIKRPTVVERPLSRDLQNKWRTASFIPPYNYSAVSKTEKDGPHRDVEMDVLGVTDARAPKGVFDFDALPPRTQRCSCERTRLEQKQGQALEAPKVVRRVRFQSMESETGPGFPTKGRRGHEAHMEKPAPAVASPNRLISLALRLGRRLRKGKASARNRYPGPSAMHLPLPVIAQTPSLASSTALLDVKESSDQRPDVNEIVSNLAGFNASSRLTGSCSVASAHKSTENRRTHYLSVPAFSVPLTLLLSPVIIRAQWIIVVRSAMLALALVCCIGAGLVAIPIP